MITGILKNTNIFNGEQLDLKQFYHVLDRPSRILGILGLCGIDSVPVGQKTHVGRDGALLYHL